MYQRRRCQNVERVTGRQEYVEEIVESTIECDHADVPNSHTFFFVVCDVCGWFWEP